MIVEVIAPKPIVVSITEPDPNEVEVSYVRGLTGATGAKGDTGATGPQGLSGVVAVDGTYITNSGTSSSANLSFVPSALTIGQSQVTGLVSALAAKAALTANQTFTGLQTITPSASNTVALTVKALASQSVSIQEWRNSSNTVVGWVNASGDSSFGQVNIGWALRLTNGSASNVAAIFKGAASQTANLQEWQNSAGSILGRVASDGTITGAALSTTNTLIQDLGIRFTVTTTPTAPGSTRGRLYFKAGTTGLALFAMGPTGTEVRIADNLT